MENPVLLLIFIIFLTILVIIQITIGVVVVTNVSMAQEYLDFELVRSFRSYATSKSDAIFWDRIQIENKCCGLHSYGDYEHIPIPPSCCGYVHQDADGQCLVENCWRTGCRRILANLYRTILKYLTGTAIGLGCVQITGIIFAFYLYAKFR
ncbi:CD63 antigen-like [Sitodiplosis mosellana]|uniref:CD63 antigen-like n=1 Tax=Sitodiplosis mosellana TaxID=263140 RepID=UPI002443EDDC|nr:CD63 antigen-like [Sitodiplosis mosellana]